jgi:hypothetical protein
VRVALTARISESAGKELMPSSFSLSERLTIAAARL